MGSNNEIKKYYRNIKKMFPVNSKKEKQYLSELKLQIDEFCSNNDTYDYQTLEKEFGTPIDIAVSYYENIDSDYILKRTSIKATLKKIFIALFCILIMTIFTLIIYNQLIYNAHENTGKITREVTIQEE